MLAISSFAGDATYLWTFDADPPGSLPKGFVIRTLFDGRPAGEWKVLPTERAKSPPQVLAQLMGKGAEHAYKVVLIESLRELSNEALVKRLGLNSA